MKYDSAIKSFENDFKNVIRSVLTKMFKVNLEFAGGINRIYVDLNSCLSILFRHGDINNDEDLNTIITDVIEPFLTDNLNAGRNIYILYTMKPSKVHRTVFPDWCKDRDSRVDIRRSDYLKKLLVSLKIFSEKNNALHILNYGEAHCAVAVSLLDKRYGSQSLVMSKDTVFKCIGKPSICIFNGVEWIDLSTNICNTSSGVLLSDPLLLNAYYFTIRGDKRNEYSGVKGYGPTLTERYVENNKLKFIANVEHPLKEHVDKFLCLYDAKEMLNKTKELEINLDQFTK